MCVNSYFAADNHRNHLKCLIACPHQLITTDQGIRRRGGTGRAVRYLLQLHPRHKDAVEPLLAALTARSLRVFRDVTDITDGQSISRRVTEGLSNARMLVAWYSKTYPTRRSCQWELTAAIIAAQQDTSDTQAVERRILVLNPEAGVSHIQPLHVRDQLFISTAAVDPSNWLTKWPHA